MALAERHHNSEKKIQIKTDLNEADLIRQIPGAKWNRVTDMWETPLSWTVCNQLTAVFGKRITAGPELKSWIDEKWDSQIGPSLEAKRGDLLYEDPDLRPLQQRGVAFMETGRTVINAFEMGGGKTVMSAVAMKSVGTKRAVVCCPNSVKINWAREIEKWCDLNPIVPSDTAGKRRQAIENAGDNDVLVMNWQSVWRHSRIAGYGSIKLSDEDKTDKGLNFFAPDTVILDEAHRAGDPTSKQTRAVWYLSRSARWRWALTGTPMRNSPDDLWSLLHFLDPREWPSKGLFVERYCATAYNPHSGFRDTVGIEPSRKDEYDAAIAPFMMYVPLREVMGRDIEVIPETRHVGMKAKQKKIYDSFKRDLITRLDSGTITIQNALAETSRCFAAASAMVDVEEIDTGEIDEFDEPIIKKKIRMMEPSPKLDEFMAYLKDIAGAPTIVWMQSVDFIDMLIARLEKKKIPYSVVRGGMSDFDRQEAVDQFQAGRTQVFIGQLQTASEGLTLTRARHAAYLQRSGSFVDNRQSMFRNKRIGQEAETIVVTDFITTGTIDERFIDILATKAERFDQVVRTREELEALL